MRVKKDVPVLGFAAYSGTGKTTLLLKLIPMLRQSGLRIALIKHAHHDFDIDKPGKDSYELRKAGANQVLVASAQRLAYIRESDRIGDPRLNDLIDTLDLKQVDLVLVEGFRHVPFPKIELHRPALKHDLIFHDDSSVIAVATDGTIDTAGLPRLDINRPDQVMRFIVDWMNA